MDEIVGLVFNMTDCLSEDDDEDLHPVNLHDFFVYSCTGGIVRKKYHSRTGNILFPDGNCPPQRITPGIIHEMPPVVQDRCSCGLIGL